MHGITCYTQDEYVAHEMHVSCTKCRYDVLNTCEMHVETCRAFEVYFCRNKGAPTLCQEK